MYETESVITMVLGLWMVNVVFSLGHRLLNFQSARVTYFVNASLFIYLVHHPLTLLYGAWITPVIKSNTLGFIGGLVFVVGIALMLYEIHLRIPLLRFLFSGKPMNKPAKTRLGQLTISLCGTPGVRYACSSKSRSKIILYRASKSALSTGVALSSQR
jgi:glucan biosynthesis protein C